MLKTRTWKQPLAGVWQAKDKKRTNEKSNKQYKPRFPILTYKPNPAYPFIVSPSSATFWPPGTDWVPLAMGDRAVAGGGWLPLVPHRVLLLCPGKTAHPCPALLLLLLSAPLLLRELQPLSFHCR